MGGGSRAARAYLGTVPMVPNMAMDHNMGKLDYVKGALIFDNNMRGDNEGLEQA